MQRRSFIFTIAGLSLSSLASAQTRTPLPGSGSIVVPSPFRTKTDYPNYADRVPDALVAYRNWDATISGQPDCDGMLAVGLPARWESFDRFVLYSRGALSGRWSAGTTIPGQKWDGKEKLYPIERSESAQGEERTQQMAVTRSGWLSTYDEPAHLYAIAHRRGLHIAVWQYDKHGGVAGGRKLANEIAASFGA